MLTNRLGIALIRRNYIIVPMSFRKLITSDIIFKRFFFSSLFFFIVLGIVEPWWEINAFIPARIISTSYKALLIGYLSIIFFSKFRLLNFSKFIRDGSLDIVDIY